eukprot:TRINITY_DN16829_c0_g1_i1.p2 TRINITY_DN16829_c0_g1~~TRINITY_DN16829_c0_g1_i1.p2  ORF type:complete len:119 (-),score=23.13 TRINITY_DN16829_c0_g1_i1:276-632(-)
MEKADSPELKDAGAQKLAKIFVKNEAGQLLLECGSPIGNYELEAEIKKVHPPDKADAEPAAILFYSVDGRKPSNSYECEAAGANYGFWYDWQGTIGEGATEDLVFTVKYIHSWTVFGK